jgi:hypothetical protein
MYPAPKEPCNFGTIGGWLVGRCGADDCVEVTNAYSDRFGQTGNKLDRCASCVSSRICEVIAGLNAGSWNPVFGAGPGILPRELADALACQNRCMSDYWKRRDTLPWRRAKTICSRFGESSMACCAASILAEQDGYNRCAKTCFPALNAIPYSLRIFFAMKGLDCCGDNPPGKRFL